MKARVINVWDKLLMGFWFVPTIVTGACALLAFGLPLLDRGALDALMPWEYAKMSATTAQVILGTIAGAMVTVAGVVFSITIVTLTIASAQFGPRLLRTFMAMRFTHVALGLFVGTSLYSFIVLSRVRGTGEDVQDVVPHVSVLVAVLLCVASLAYLVYYIHRTASIIQAPNLLRLVADDLNDSIERMFPDDMGTAPKSPAHEDSLRRFAESISGDTCPIPAQVEGYLQAIDMGELMDLTVKEDILLDLRYRPGHFMVRGAVLGLLWPGERNSDDLCRRINDAFIVGNQPTPRQDLECAVNELVEVAVRALSPGINDPFTAINSIDRLGAAMSRLAKQEIPSRYRIDSEGKLRVIVNVVAFPDVLDAAVNQIRQNTGNQISVIIRLLEALSLIAAHTRCDADRQAVMRQARVIRDAARLNRPAIPDMRDVNARYDSVCKAVETHREALPKQKMPTANRTNSS